MKRRDMLRVMPLSMTGMTSLAFAVIGSDSNNGKEATPLALQYLDRISEMLEWVRDNQAGNLMEGAYRIARTVKNGNRCWSRWNLGHNSGYDLFPDRNGVPDMFTLGFRQDEAKDGDLLLMGVAGNTLSEVKKRGVFIIGSPTPYSYDSRGQELLRDDLWNHRSRPHCDLWIDTPITREGAVLEVPGSETKLGPASGILGMTTFWMMAADACRVLARDGITLPVWGDEPPLETEGVPDWHFNAPADLDEPLMYRYFERITTRIELIRAEMGAIRKAAGLVVNASLDGGIVYSYSHDRNAIAVEGSSRRGGLSMFKGIYDGGEETDFKLTHPNFDYPPFSERDCVVMGITRPDDPVDMENFEIFRKAGVRIVSIGPMTRSFKVPEGKTIPKQADVHLGQQCDAFGLFHIPGFEKKVCPISGAINNQLYWALCCQVVDTFSERTNGDLPGIFGNVAIRGMRNQMRHLWELYKERGY